MSGAVDRFEQARRLADTVLYEGYILYPYRASSCKNQLRFQFGVLVPKSYRERDPSERSTMRTECLLEPATAPGRASLSVRVRFLQVQKRSIEAWSGDEFAPVSTVEVDGRTLVGFEEAVERAVDLEVGNLSSGLARDAKGICRSRHFSFAGTDSVELVRGRDGSVRARIVRCLVDLHGLVSVAVTSATPDGRYLKAAVTVENVTECVVPPSPVRSDVLASSLGAAHCMLAVEGGRFVSLLDPPSEAEAAAGACRSEGSFPVLVGDDDVVLSSPIILYDHPEVAPESPGDLFDATEIDEILALRVLTLTDEEKAEARATDSKAAAIIERCDTMPPEVWARLHGTVRSLEPLSAGKALEPEPWWDPESDASADPWIDSVVVAGVEVSKGSAVVLRPSRRADAQDLFLTGQVATVAGVFTDVEGRQQVAVTLDDDPATIELAWQGRFLYFHPDEVEPIAPPPDGAIGEARLGEVAEERVP
jgi:hypothetical protein